MKNYLPINCVDAQEKNKENPETFEVPTIDDLNKIAEKSYVKICFNQERFWVCVEKVEGDEIFGTVDNDLIQTEIRFGDKVSFFKKNVYDIF